MAHRVARVRARAALGAMVAMASALMFTAAPSATAATAPHGELRFATSSDIPMLDPLGQNDTASDRALDMIYDQLVEYNQTNQGLHPGLAQRYTISKDGLTYTFYLRKNVKFSNGDPLTAEDVIFSLNRITSQNATPSGPAPYGSSYSDIVGYQKWFDSKAQAKIGEPGMSGLTSPAPGVVQIKLQIAQPYFLYELAMAAGSIVDAKVAQKYGVNYQLHATGTGPFKLQSWNRGHQMILVANPTCWKGEPKVAKIVYDENVSYDLQMLRFEKGQYDFVFGPLPTEIYAKVLASPSLKKLYHVQPWNAYTYLAFNTTKPPFNNIYLRQAANYAIDRALILRDITNNRGTVMTQTLPPGVAGYNPAVKGYTYNVAKAKALVKESGYKGQPISLVYPSNTSDNVRLAQIIQQELSAIGLKVQITGYSQIGSYWSLTDTPSANWNICWDDWWMDYPDAQDIFLNLLSTQSFNGNNSGNWTDPQFQKLIDAGDTMPPSQTAQRIADYQKAEQIAVSDASWLFLYDLWQDALVQPWIHPQGTKADLMLYLHPVIEPQFNLMTTTYKP